MKKNITPLPTLFEIVLQRYPDSSKTTIRSWLREERLLIDGKPASSLDTPLSQETSFSLAPKKKYISSRIEILYEDKDLVVVDKPAGLLSVATDHQKTYCVHTILKRRYHTRRVFPVHRLDRDTSGVLVFAYSEHSRDDLKKQFEAHTIEREYYALVKGSPTPSQGTWKSYLVEEKNFFVRSTLDKRGKIAITHYSVLKTNGVVSLLRLSLETGRKNQIRVHAKDAGHPLIGDEKYNPSLSEEEHRLCLHAGRLAFQHPRLEKKLEFKSPSPYFFERLVR